MCTGAWHQKINKQVYLLYLIIRGPSTPATQSHTFPQSLGHAEWYLGVHLTQGHLDLGSQAPGKIDRSRYHHFRDEVRDSKNVPLEVKGLTWPQHGLFLQAHFNKPRGISGEQMPPPPGSGEMEGVSS